MVEVAEAVKVEEAEDEVTEDHLFSDQALVSVVAILRITRTNVVKKVLILRPHLEAVQIFREEIVGFLLEAATTIFEMTELQLVFISMVTPVRILPF